MAHFSARKTIPTAEGKPFPTTKEYSKETAQATVDTDQIQASEVSFDLKKTAPRYWFKIK